MTSSSRGRRALQIVAVLLGIPILGAGLAWFWIQHTADRKWAEARLRIQELTRAFPTTLPPHPTSEISKELQLHFVAAIREAARRNIRQAEARILVSRGQGGDAVDVILGDAQDFLDRLHEGARRCAAMPAEFPPGWRGEWDEDTLRFMMSCGALRARRQRESGAALGGAETVLDCLQLGRFWAASGTGGNRVSALRSLDRPLEELRDILERDDLSRDELLRIDLELAPLDAAWRPPTIFLEPALARWAAELEKEDPFTQIVGDVPYRWRYLLPAHLMKAEAFEFYDRHIRRLLEDQGKPYPETARDLGCLVDEMNASKNPIISSNHLVFDSSEWDSLFRKAEIRLLRVAARYRASGEILTLEDPFGGNLLHSRTGNRMKFWSRAGDGRDDGGDAGSESKWTRPVPVPGVPQRLPIDRVIEVPAAP